jgi:mono/diheme cytochrome c family protein
MRLIHFRVPDFRQRPRAGIRCSEQHSGFLAIRRRIGALAAVLRRTCLLEETMRARIVCGVIAGVALAAVASAQDAKVAKGEKLFVDQKCTLCHSIGDKGNKKGPLDGVATKLKADEIHDWITDAKGMTAKMKTTRKPDMKAYTLPKEDVDALVAYLATLKK